MKKENRETIENRTESDPIQIWYDREPERIRDNTAYYNGPCTVRLCLDEGLGEFNQDGMEVVWETDTETENAIEKEAANPWKANWWTYRRESGRYEKEYLADQDGTYRCRLTYTDQEGQVFHREGAPFVVDQTAPRISAECIQAETGGEITVLVEVEEESFSREDTRIYSKNRADGEWQEMELSWILVGDSALTQVNADPDEVEELWVTAEDLAGNRAEYRQEVEIPLAQPGGDGQGAFFAALTLLGCFCLLTVFTGVRKIFL